MKPRAPSVASVAARVGAALRGRGIRAVLTGGACAGLHSGGVYTSSDADFVLLDPTRRVELDEALASIGFRRVRDGYRHRTLPYQVEFPRGPLGIGQDLDVRPVLARHRGATFLALSATDSCRDRLAAFYHWNDRQSLRVAAWIALRRRVDRRRIRAWSRREGHGAGYEEFEREVARVRTARARRRG